LRQVAVIAVAVAVIVAVLLLTGGVLAAPKAPGTLSFFGVTVHTTSAQIFLTGAICSWTLLAASWLLTAGIRRSRRRAAQLTLHRRGITGRGRPATAEPSGRVGTRELAELLGFAVRGKRAVADRAGLGGGGNGAESGQDPAEEPLGGQ
jgi:hypothetical protein